MKVFGFLTVLAVSVASIIGIGHKSANESKTAKKTSLPVEKIQADKPDSKATSLFSEIKRDEINKSSDEIEIAEDQANEKAVAPKLVQRPKARKVKTQKVPKTKAQKIVAIQKEAIEARLPEDKNNLTDSVETAQSSTSTMELDTKAQADKKKADALSVLDPSLAGGRKGFRGQLGISGNTDFKQTSDETKTYYSQFTLNLFYDLDGGDNIGLFVPMQKDLSGEFEEKFFLDSRLSYAQNGIYRSENLIFNMRYGFLYPTTETSKVRDEMIAGLELNPTLIFPLSKLVKGLTFIYIPRYRKRFHRFTTNRAGESLVTDSLLNIMVANYSFADKWYVSSTLLHVASQRYDGARTDDSYLTVQELGYQYNAQMVFTMGIMQGGNIINKQYGESESIEVFDANASEFYTGFNYAF
jgi:hypothetical protein